MIARTVEQRSWMALWLRAGPMVGVGLGLAAWAVVEPENAERLSFGAGIAAVAVALLWARAIVRAARAVWTRDPPIIAGTIGLFRPRVVLSGLFTSVLDPRALRAAEAHERAHARHRDPLRILLARFATDLLWPTRSAPVRFRAWRHALELARDEEAISAGHVRGADLAAALIAAARLQPAAADAGAMLLSDGELLRHRVEWLLTVRRGRIRRDTVVSATAAIIVAFVSLWVAVGATAAEAIVEPFLLR